MRNAKVHLKLRFCSVYFNASVSMYVYILYVMHVAALEMQIEKQTISVNTYLLFIQYHNETTTILIKTYFLYYHTDVFYA